MLVLKFGGTSVSSKPSIETICKIAKRELTQKPVIVVSALSNVTNLLVALAKQQDKVAQKEIITQISTIHLDLIKQIFIAADQVYLQVIDYIQSKLAELTQVVKEVPAEYTLPQWQDRIVAYGETMSSFLIAQFLTLNGVKALPVSATQFLVTNNNFGAANFIKRLTQQKAKQLILPLIKQQIVPIITGFIGATVDGQITTLGRGGSDYSASIIGYALKSKEIQIWTDVDGVYSTDPRVVKDARLLTSLSYKEASELAMFGAKVLHPRTILPAIAANIPVRVLNTFNPEGSGTLITKVGDSSGLIKAVTAKALVPLINIYSVDMFLSKGFLKKIFAVFTKHNISVDLVSASEVSVSVTLDNTENVQLALKELNRFANVTQINEYGSVSLVGEQIMSVPALLPKVFSLFEAHSIPVYMLSYNAMNINVVIVVPSRYVNKAVELLHANFLA